MIFFDETKISISARNEAYFDVLNNQLYVFFGFFYKFEDKFCLF